MLPHRAMNRLYPDVTVMYEMGDKDTFAIDKLTDDELKTYNIVCFLRQVNSDKDEDAIDRCHRLGCKVVFDIDDYWVLPPDHNLKWASQNMFRSPGGNLVHYKSEGRKLTYVDAVPAWLRRVDYVTTTTDTFAEIIYEFNPNVAVMPNCIDPMEPQFKDTQPTRSSLVRYGWIGGVHHKPDLEMLAPTFSGFANKRQESKGMQFVLGGYNPNREYQYIEKILTGNYKLFSYDRVYIADLMAQQPDGHRSLFKPYRRLWAAPVHQYASMYNEIDVALIPLRGNKFSACKSELKLIEAGWFKKPVICSDVLPYNSIVKHNANGLINGTRYWREDMKRMLDKSMREDLGEALHDTVKKAFDIDTWAHKRYELYKSILA